MTRRTVKFVLFGCFGVLVLIGGLGTALVVHWGKVHQHCMKATGMAFSFYAARNGGSLPYHTNGFGDALLLLVKGGDLPDVACICGPGDDGKLLAAALTNGSNVPEELCSRVYVQGLSTTNNHGICILFDRRSVKGGDHKYGFGPFLREVCMVDGSMLIIEDARWPEFVRKQIELLKEAGIPESEAEKLYAPPEKK